MFAVKYRVNEESPVEMTGFIFQSDSAAYAWASSHNFIVIDIVDGG